VLGVSARLGMVYLCFTQLKLPGVHSPEHVHAQVASGDRRAVVLPEREDPAIVIAGNNLEACDDSLISLATVGRLAVGSIVT